MPVYNSEIAKILGEIADLLDISGENQFRIRSYRNAAKIISGSSQNIAQIEPGRIRALPGIGKSIAEKIDEYKQTGQISQLNELRSLIPPSLIEIMKLEQMGPRRTRVLFDELKIESPEELKDAAEAGQIEKLGGFGKKISESILRETREYLKKSRSKRVKLHEAGQMIGPVIEFLEKKIEAITVAGSYRRCNETVGDIDLVGISSTPEEAIEHFVNYGEVKRVVVKGQTSSSIKLQSELQIDLRIFDRKSYGAATLYFTGSRSHTIALRSLGQKKGYKINEYGLYKGKSRLAGKTEKDIYNKLGLDYIEPELREDTGEIDDAKNSCLPELIGLTDIKGDLHCHTNATDGKYSLEDMAMAAEQMGYEYLAITDHSKRVAMARGLDEKRLAAQIMEIDELNGKMKRLKILKSVEADILEDGAIDLSNDILKELDLVVCAVHFNRNFTRKRQTLRVLRGNGQSLFQHTCPPDGKDDRCQKRI